MLRDAVTKELVLVGGGHAHVQVLKRFGMAPLPGVRLTLVTRDVETPYSGMLPGLIAGHYTRDDCHIDLMRLARFAGARLIHAEAEGIDRAARLVLCRGRPPVRYDLLSLDIGSTPKARDVPGAADHTIAVKPVDRLAARWEGLLEELRGSGNSHELVVVGGGPAGVEMTLAMQHRLNGLCGGHPPRFALVTRGDLLERHNPKVRDTFRRALAERGVTVHADAEVSRVEPGALVCADGRRIAFDTALWAVQTGAAPWLRDTGLDLDGEGFVAVDAPLRSTNDPRVFAAGDVASVLPHPREKAGVFAVRQGPPLAGNLHRTLQGKPPRPFVPQKENLALVSTGDRDAVASCGWLFARGRWVWAWKDRIDRRFMRTFQELPPMRPRPAGAAPEAMRCGGGGAEMALGFAVTGAVATDRILRKGGLRPGDALVLTKPLGTGTLLAATMAGSAKGRWVAAALAVMQQSAGPAAACLIEHGAGAATDVTGFGLLGHLLEMLDASGADARLDLDALPVLETLGAGIVSTLHPANAAAEDRLDPPGAREPQRALLFDPQTAGGLLAGVPGDRAEACVAALRALGYREAAVIGRVEPCAGPRPHARIA